MESYYNNYHLKQLELIKEFRHKVNPIKSVKESGIFQEYMDSELKQKEQYVLERKNNFFKDDSVLEDNINKINMYIDKINKITEDIKTILDSMCFEDRNIFAANTNSEKIDDTIIMHNVKINIYEHY